MKKVAVDLSQIELPKAEQLPLFSGVYVERAARKRGEGQPPEKRRIA
jgi:hypothetical protein